MWVVLPQISGEMSRPPYLLCSEVKHPSKRCENVKKVLLCANSFIPGILRSSSRCKAVAGLAGTILTILDYPPLVGPTNPPTTQHLTVSSEPRDKLATTDSAHTATVGVRACPACWAESPVEHALPVDEGLLEHALPPGEGVLHVWWVPGWWTATHWVQDLRREVFYLARHEGREEQEDGVLHQHHQHPQQSWDDGLQGCDEWSFRWISNWNFCPEGVYLDSAQIF